MRITELGDCSVVIEKGEEDRDDFTIGSMFKGKNHPRVGVFVPDESFEVYRASEYIFTETTLIIYIKHEMPIEFKEGVHVGVKVGNDWYETNYENSRNR